jgi:hypothetical protein
MDAPVLGVEALRRGDGSILRGPLDPSEPPENTDWYLRAEEGWTVIDKWWTDEQERRSYIVLRAPNGKTAAVCWSYPEEAWSLIEQPGGE